MLTPQEINDKGFDKVMLNGYDTGEVDDFLDEVSNDYNALYKENAILKGKLKVLVEKVEEYRTTEDAMRMALLTAQRMGEEITVEAKRAKDEMLQSAENEIKTKLTETAKRIAEEEARLALAAKETTKFIELSQAIMRKHTEFLSKLDTARRAVKPKSTQSTSAKAPRSAKAPPQSVQSAQAAHGVQNAPARAVSQPMQPAPSDQSTKPLPNLGMKEVEVNDIAMQISSAVGRISEDEVAAPPNANPAPAPAPLFEDDDSSTKLYSPDDRRMEEEHVDEISPRPKFDFDDLKFGANFDGDD
jgi:cell division initiation protein